jgi:hypothetical protein
MLEQIKKVFTWLETAYPEKITEEILETMLKYALKRLECDTCGKLLPATPGIIGTMNFKVLEDHTGATKDVLVFECEDCRKKREKAE